MWLSPYASNPAAPHEANVEKRVLWFQIAMGAA
jgi:hypothetical protein